MSRKSLLTLGLLAGAALSITVPAAPASPRCRAVRGHIDSELLAGPECASPVGLCTRGHFTGDIRGSFVFTATSLTPSADTPATGVVHYTGDIVIQTRQGRIVIKDAGAFNALPDSTGDVGGVSTLTGGTGRYAGVSGRIRIAGTFTPADGGNSEYSGEINVP
jgi:hypothetical protein